MKKVYISFFVLTLFGCATMTQVANPTINVSPIIVSPPQNITYNITQIESNISHINEGKANNDKEIENLERNITNHKYTNTGKIKAKQMIDSLKESNTKYDALLSSYDAVGYSIKEYRAKHDKDLLKTITRYNFDSFLGLAKENLLSNAVKLYGNNFKKDSLQNNLRFYNDKNDLALFIKANDSTGRIYEVRVVGEEGYYFLLKKNIPDSKFRYIGFNVSEIENLLGLKLNYSKQNEYYSYKFNYYGDIEIGFYADPLNNYVCDEIRVRWY